MPLTLFHIKSLADLSDVPLLLHVYGAYGLDLNMTFSPEKRLLLENNWALAYCHVRYQTLTMLCETCMICNYYGKVYYYTE